MINNWIRKLCWPKCTQLSSQCVSSLFPLFIWREAQSQLFYDQLPILCWQKTLSLTVDVSLAKKITKFLREFSRPIKVSWWEVSISTICCANILSYGGLLICKVQRRLMMPRRHRKSQRGFRCMNNFQIMSALNTRRWYLKYFGLKKGQESFSLKVWKSASFNPGFWVPNKVEDPSMCFSMSAILCRYTS